LWLETIAKYRWVSVQVLFNVDNTFLCAFQMVIDAQLVPLLVSVLAQGEFKAQKEAAWAVSNFTVGGTPQQVITSGGGGGIDGMGRREEGRLVEGGGMVSGGWRDEGWLVEGGAMVSGGRR
jgi:hypothetical protein